MKKYTATLLCILAAVTLSYGKKTLVLGAGDSLPVAGASVLTHSGHITGITDRNGTVQLPDASAYPLTLRSVGYEILEITEPADTIVLNATEYELPEVPVSATGRPVRRVVWYAREYSTGTTGRDTMQLYSEYMFQSFVTDRKVKGYRSSDSRLATKAVRRYGRIAGADGRDSVFVPDERDDITALAWGENFCTAPDGVTEETAAIRGGAPTDSTEGKYSTERIFRKGGNRYTVITDLLSGHKEHTWSPSLFKLLGMTIDLEGFNTTACYQQNEKGVYDVYDLLYASTDLDVLARGKMFRWLLKSKEPLRIKTGIELYPVEMTTHSPEEYNELRRDKTPLEFRLPPSVLPDIPAVTGLKRRLAAGASE